MSQPFLPFALPDIGDEEIAAVTEALRSGWVTTGPKTRQFELAFTEYLGGGVESLAVNSATAGLHLALEALGIGPGDEVITTTLTFTATAEVVRYLGADPVLIDVDPITLNIDVSKIRAAITPRTKAIVPVHYAGLACQMNEVLAIAREYGLKVVEDAAHALPATLNGTLVGQLQSDITVFSFYANKTMTTGEGGMVVTRSAALAQRMKIMRLHGMNRDAFDRFTSKTPAWYYEVVAPGFKYNLTDIASAIGVEQLAVVVPVACGRGEPRNQLARCRPTAGHGCSHRVTPKVLGHSRANADSCFFSNDTSRTPQRCRAGQHSGIAERPPTSKWCGAGRTANDCINAQPRLKAHAHARFDGAQVIGGVRWLLSLDQCTHACQPGF